MRGNGVDILNIPPRLGWSSVKGELGTELGSCFGRGKLLRDQEF